MNTFYNAFDFETMEPAKKLDYRTVFQRDRDRIIHSSAFRRLQAKTQVFLSGEYDFYRTRLTHSMEVAQIGRSICNFLRAKSSMLSADFFIDPDLVEAVCLAHDIGHPPFGHAGERTLHRLMADYGGFEGNAQTLRMLTQIIYSDAGERRGMNPCRALMDGVLKYKSLYGQLEKPDNHFLYNQQKPYLLFAFGGKQFPAELQPGKPLNSFRSIECQIMDWADDTAYSLNDVVDGINAGFISRDKIENWAGEQELLNEDQDRVDGLLHLISEQNVEREFARKIGEFIRGCQLKKWQNFMSGETNRYAFRLDINPQVQQESKFYKQLALDLVFRSPQLHQLEYKGDFILSRIFRALWDNYIADTKKPFRLLPGEADTLLRQAAPEFRPRLICDQLAGMTDGFAIRTFKRLFDADFGSIVDLI